MLLEREYLRISGGNRRLEAAYRNNPELINREFTLPVPVVTLYEAPQVARTSGLRFTIENHVRVIITPKTYAQLSPERKKEVTVLSAPYESGRVLEADEPVIIDGEERVLSVKGIGATTFYRNTGAINPWMRYGGRYTEFTDDQRQHLQEYPFWEDAGVLTEREAFNELHNAQEMTKLGVNTEKVLGIYHLEALPDSTGEEVLQIVLNKKAVKTTDVQKELEVSRQQAHSLLSSLVKKEILQKFGKTKTSYYKLHPNN